jgi:hypothetical protein
LTKGYINAEGQYCFGSAGIEGRFMPIVPYVKLYVVSLFIFIIVDLIWIAGIMKNFYLSQLGALSRMTGGSMSPNIPSRFLA